MDRPAAPDVLRLSAFAATPDGGNPAGVVLDASALDDDAMLRIAQEVGYAETAFVTASSERDGVVTVSVRYFSPGAEVPFCGHATVATAVVLAERTRASTMRFETSVGAVDMIAKRTDTGAEVSFTSVEPEVRPLAREVLEQLLGLLGLDAVDLDPDLPPREAFAGNWHPVLAVGDRERFDGFGFEPNALSAAMLEHGWSGTVTVLHRLGPAEFFARNLFPVGDILEDPATGSAAAAVGAYLREIARVPADGRFVIRQGDHVGRPSLLRVQVPRSGGIVVTGGAIAID